MVREGHTKPVPAAARLEWFASDQRLQSGHQRFQFSKHLLSTDRGLVASSAPDQKTVSKHLAKPFEGPAHGRLAYEHPVCRARDMPFL